MLAAYGAVAGYFFGFMLNLSFWPFSRRPGSSIAYLPGAAVRRAVAPLPGLRRHHLARLGHRPRRHQHVCILLVGPAVLRRFAGPRAARTSAPPSPSLRTR